MKKYITGLDLEIWILFRNHQSLNYSTTFQHFMETERSLTWWQEPATGPYPEGHAIAAYFLLFSHQCLDLPDDRFLSGLPTKTLYAFRFAPIHATFPIHLILLNFTILITSGEGTSPSFYNFLLPPVISSLFSQNVLLSTLFSIINFVSSVRGPRHSWSG
jgi:hypothetical protein